MTTKKMRSLTVIAAVIVGGLVGAAIGGYFGVDLTTAGFGNRWLEEQAQDIDSRIANLKKIREGLQEEALEAMERQLEDDLISIEPDDRIKQPTLGAINTAIQNAREYRTQYPIATSRPAIEKMVEAVFKRVPY